MRKNNKFIKKVIFGMLQCIFWTLSCSFSYANETADYDVVISKSKQELSVLNGTRIIKTYRIAYGKGGLGTKQILGDKKTPQGTYKIINFKSDSKFHYFMRLNYPNLLDAWYGYKNEVITAKEFKRIANAFKTKQLPPQDTALGGYIGIHGLGDTTKQKIKIHNGHNWTEGCIAMTNDQINDLRQYVQIGTKVVIKD